MPSLDPEIMDLLALVVSILLVAALGWVIIALKDEFDPDDFPKG